MTRSLRHATALRLSLLASLGIGPLACGGTTADGPDDGGGGGGNVSGKSGKAGSTNQGGAGQTCTNPKLDPASHLVICEEGFSHRPDAVACEPTTANAAGGSSNRIAPEPQLPRADGTLPCIDDRSKCSAFLNGYCDAEFAGGLGPAATCRSGCYTDFDCGENNVCVCGNAQSPTGGVCFSANCSTDAECATGYFRASYNSLCSAGGFACQTPNDECITSQDCANQGTCVWDAVQGFRSCSAGICGRPFLVEQHARLAPTASRSDWTSRQTPAVSHLSASERAAQAEHWTHLGQMEHASIAAFARFSLQLLSLGAPAELVEGCTQALADETTHTKLCFGIASAYAGRAIGPGPLDISGSLDVTSLEDIVDLVIAEGCFGETGAALEALDAADSAMDPVIRAAYAQIAEDEQRHAELAFRFVRWALAQNDATVRSRIEASIATPSSRDSSALSVAVPCLHELLQATPLVLAEARAPANLPAT